MRRGPGHEFRRLVEADFGAENAAAHESRRGAVRVLPSGRSPPKSDPTYGVRTTSARAGAADMTRKNAAAVAIASRSFMTNAPLFFLSIAIERGFVAGFSGIRRARGVIALRPADVLVRLSQIFGFLRLVRLLGLVRGIHDVPPHGETRTALAMLLTPDMPNARALIRSRSDSLRTDPRYADVSVANDEAQVALLQIGVAINREIELAANTAIGGIERHDASAPVRSMPGLAGFGSARVAAHPGAVRPCLHDTLSIPRGPRPGAAEIATSWLRHQVANSGPSPYGSCSWTHCWPDWTASGPACPESGRFL